MISINPIISSLIAKSSSKEVAIIQGSKQHSYADIYNDSRKLATYLSTIGMKAGDTAMIATVSSYELLLILYASIILKVKIGIIDPSLDHDSYQAKIKQLDPQWAYVDSKLLFMQEHSLLKKLYPKKGITNIDLPQSDAYHTIATGSWMPLMRTYQKISQYSLHPAFDVDPSFIDYEYIISYTTNSIGKPISLVYTLGTISHTVNYIGRLIEKTKVKSFVTDLPHFMVAGITAGLQLQLWNDRWTIAQKIKFITNKKISMLSVTTKQFFEVMKYCVDQNCSLPDSLAHIIIEAALTDDISIEKMEEFCETGTKVTVMYSKAERLVMA